MRTTRPLVRAGLTLAVTTLAMGVSTGTASAAEPCQVALDGVTTCTWTETGQTGTTMVLPAGVTEVQVTVVGAVGGGTDAPGGLGAVVQGRLVAAAGTTLEVRVGLPGQLAAVASDGTAVPAGGGTASAVRVLDPTTGLADPARVVVAGGGGGAAAALPGGSAALPVLLPPVEALPVEALAVGAVVVDQAALPSADLALLSGDGTAAALDTPGVGGSSSVPIDGTVALDLSTVASVVVVYAPAEAVTPVAPEPAPVEVLPELPVEPAPVEPAPVEPTPADPAPVELATAPVTEPVPAQPTPTEAAPVEQAPGETPPVEAVPVPEETVPAVVAPVAVAPVDPVAEPPVVQALPSSPVVAPVPVEVSATRTTAAPVAAAPAAPAAQLELVTVSDTAALAQVTTPDDRRLVGGVLAGIVLVALVVGGLALGTVRRRSGGAEALSLVTGVAERD